MNNWLAQTKKRLAQENLRLTKTKLAIDMLTDARMNMLPEPIIEEIEHLIRSTAIHEWGEGTIIDDFSREGAIIVTKSKRIEIIQKSKVDQFTSRLTDFGGAA